MDAIRSKLKVLLNKIDNLSVEKATDNEIAEIFTSYFQIFPDFDAKLYEKECIEV